MDATTKKNAARLWSKSEIQKAVDIVQEEIASKYMFSSYRNEDRTAIHALHGEFMYVLSPYPFDTGERNGIAATWQLARYTKDYRPTGYSCYGRVDYQIQKLEDLILA